jgi:hypothetical protein
VKDLVLGQGEHAPGAVTGLADVEDLEVLEQRVGELDAGLPTAAESRSVCTRPQNDSITALSKQSPIEPIDGTRPESWARRVNAHEVEPGLHP